MKPAKNLAAAIAACMLSTVAAQATTVFNFDNDNLGTATGFTDTVGGLSATFSSNNDPGGFVVYQSIFETLTGNVLGDPGPAGQDGLTLSVNFNQSLSVVTLDFATSDFATPSPFTLTAYENGTLVGSATQAGQFLPGFTFPEGEIAFQSSAFNSFTLSSTATDFAVDNITVAAATTAEPASFGLFAVALMAAGLPAIRRKRRPRIMPGASMNLLRGLGLSALALVTTAFASAQSTQTIFPIVPPSVSTIPSNGDVNPYGVAFVPKNVAKGWTIQPGDILVSNFNNSSNLQGLGTTITRIDSAGHASTFYRRSKFGLSAAIGVLSDGIVLVGNLPTADGTFATVQPGALSVLDGNGDFLGTFGTIASVNGPWGMAVYDTGNGSAGMAHVFLSNVLSGTVSRFDIAYSATTIGATVIELATGFAHRGDPAALVLGPSGLAYDSIHNLLYVANSDDNSIYTIPNAATAASTQSATPLIQDFAHLHGPLDIAILPNGHLVVANSDGSNVDPNQPSELVEYTPGGQFLGQMSVDPNNGGAFGIAAYNIGWGTFRMAAVDDNTNSLNIWTLVAQ